MFKVSINTWDSLTGEFMGGKDYFDILDEAKEYYNKMIIDYADDSEVYLVNCRTNTILEQHITTYNNRG